MCIRDRTWSLAAAYRGVHPDRDPHGRLFTREDGVWYSRAGKALASTDGVSEGYFLVLWTIKCDLDYVAKGFGLPSHNANKCHLCDCDNFARPWTDVSRTAAWLQTIWTRGTFRSTHHIFRSLPGSTITAMIGDILRTKHLGSDSYFVGGLLRL